MAINSASPMKYSIFFKYWHKQVKANGVDSDQTPQNVASDQSTPFADHATPFANHLAV